METMWRGNESWQAGRVLKELAQSSERPGLGEAPRVVRLVELPDDAEFRLEIRRCTLDELPKGSA